MSQEVDRKQTTRELATAAVSYIRQKYYHKTTATFYEVAVRKDLRVDVLCIGWDDEVTVFEIKSCKEDFKADKKWEKYLDYCNYFYFITTEGVIKPEDLPDGVGLIYFVKQDGSKKYYNLIRQSKRFKGRGLTNSWFKTIYKRLAFRVAGEDNILNNGGE